MGLSENGVYLPNGTLIGKIITLDLEGSCFQTKPHRFFLSEIPLKCAKGLSIEFTDKWVCLKIGYIPNEIAIFHRDNDQQNHWV